MLIKLKYFEFLTRSCDPRPTLGNLRMAILAQPHNKQWQNIIEAFVLKLLIKTHLALSLSVLVHKHMSNFFAFSQLCEKGIVFVRIF